jgi:hypothetical protein
MAHHMIVETNKKFSTFIHNEYYKISVTDD